MKRLSACVLSLALSVSMVLPAGAAGSTFSDVPQSHWAYSYVEDMTREGVMAGVGGGLFDPDRTLSTAEFAVMLTRAFCAGRLDLEKEPANWWEPYVDAAWAAGYLTDTTAGWGYIQSGSWDEETVTAPMSRYDMAQAMWNTAMAENMPLPTDQQREAAQRAIGDFASIPEDYESAVVTMYALGCLSGVNEAGDFGGESALTRAQSCVVMRRLLDQAERESQPESGDAAAAYEREVFDLVNQIRAENGLEPFVYNSALAAIARAHSQDMADRGFLAHEDPDGNNVDDRLNAAGIRWSLVAENIAAGYASPEAVVSGWMSSEGHRANILGRCREVGVGLAQGGSYGSYWTLCFATVR